VAGDELGDCPEPERGLRAVVKRALNVGAAAVGDQLAGARPIVQGRHLRVRHKPPRLTRRRRRNAPDLHVCHAQRQPKISRNRNV
jgi:hypothetical protein